MFFKIVVKQKSGAYQAHKNCKLKKCFFRYFYSESHPVKILRRKYTELVPVFKNEKAASIIEIPERALARHGFQNYVSGSTLYSVLITLYSLYFFCA